MKTLIVALYPYNSQGLDSWHDHSSGMTYTAAKLAGCDVSFLDMKTLFNYEQLVEATKGYDLIAFGLKSSYYLIAMEVIKAAKSHGSKVIVGGYHATAAPHELLENKDIDWVFHGESELTFPKFLKSPLSFKREITGEVVQNLDSLPFMDRSIFRDQTENCSGWWYGGKSRMISVISSRGCPYKCAFCQPLEDNHFGKILRRRTVNSVITELKWLKETYSPDCVMIHDDTFLLQVPWLEEFIKRYPEIGLPFWAAGRADGICKYPDLVKRLVDVGWDLISVGFESGSQRILDKMNKGTTVEQNLEAARIIKSAGAKIYANYMLGLPWESRWDVQATMKMADEIDAEMPSWAYFTPYPGCALDEECQSNNWSLLTRSTYDRCPSGRKVHNVDYSYLLRVLQGLREDYPQETCDIIVPTYENSEYSIACFKSIIAYTKPGSYRIIWVDNGSKDPSSVEESLHGSDYISIKLKKNEGFVGAVNRGIKASTAPYVCLLNNDTQVSNRWLEKIISTLEKDDKLGILGALTNINEGPGVDSHHSLRLHEVLIPTDKLPMTLSEVNTFLEENYSGRTSPISFVAFLCAVIKREVINKVGLLDPHYAMGMYDDNDYNIAARKLGYRTELALDTCIYHKGRTTFRLIQETEKFNVEELLRKNLLYLNQKWGYTKGRITLGGPSAETKLDYRPDNWMNRIAVSQEKMLQRRKRILG
jgi:anaerobic magnesium-protoporphyrin IX monomethyl ester cyclase